MRCPVGISVLCAVTDPACQSYGQPYNMHLTEQGENKTQDVYMGGKQFRS
jgi:hypothetical protein